MGHDASKVQLGTTPSSVREVDNRKGTIAAGLVVRLKSDLTITTAAADGSALGVSLGRDESGIGRTAIARKGLRVPLQITAAFTPVVGTQVSIDDVTGKGKAAGAGVTGMNAVYATGPLTGVSEDGVETANSVALIDMIGGL